MSQTTELFSLAGWMLCITKVPNHDIQVSKQNIQRGAKKQLEVTHNAQTQVSFSMRNKTVIFSTTKHA